MQKRKKNSLPRFRLKVEEDSLQHSAEDILRSPDETSCRLLEYSISRCFSFKFQEMLGTHFAFIVSPFGCEVLTAVAVKIRAFFTVTLCRLGTAPCFGGTYHIHLQDRREPKQKTRRCRLQLSPNLQPLR
jgi:hypothetical protein